MPREAHQGTPVLQLHLVPDVIAKDLDRPRANLQVLRDLPLVESPPDEFEDLEFAALQTLGRRIRPPWPAAPMSRRKRPETS